MVLAVAVLRTLGGRGHAGGYRPGAGECETGKLKVASNPAPAADAAAHWPSPVPPRNTPPCAVSAAPFLTLPCAIVLGAALALPVGASAQAEPVPPPGPRTTPERTDYRETSSAPTCRRSSMPA